MRLKIRQMIKLMSIGLMGLAVLSCSKGDNQIEYQKPMEFSGYTARSVTKANGSFVTGAQLPKNQYFGVYAYNTGTSDTFDPEQINAQNNPYVKFMTDVAVKYIGEQTVADAQLPSNYPYSPMRYWPNTEDSNRLAFFAYYPYNGAGITRNGFADFTFTVQEAPADQIDFMLTDVIPDQRYSHTNSGTAGVVNMPFNHMLTQVRFKGITDAPDDVTVKVTELIVEDVYYKGTLAPNVAAASSEWTIDETSKADYNIVLKDIALPTNINDTEESTTEPIALADADQTLLVLPQTLSDAAKIQIKYTITTTNPARVIKETAEVALNTLIEKWEKRNQIVYILNIGLHPIEISASTEDWTEGGDIIIVE